MIKPTPNRRRADFSVSHYDNEAVSGEHQYVRKGTLTTQPEGSQEVRMLMGTTMPSTTSAMRIVPSIRQPDSPMSKPDMTPSSAASFTTAASRAPVAETILADGGGLMYNTITLEVQDMDITAPERDIYHGMYPDFQLPLPNRPCLTNSAMSILHIPNLKKMYGTLEYAIDRNTGQLYTIRDIDVYGGIPDDEVNRQLLESTLVPPKTPQATSTPITEVPRSVEETVIPRSTAHLPTPRMATIHQEVESWTSSSTLSEPSGPAPVFNLHRANVRAVWSVSSLGEDEGIINDDEYEWAVCRLQKINLKITTLIKKIGMKKVR